MDYGRTPRGPLSILKDIWTGQEDNDETMSIYRYVYQLRERLKETCEIAHQALEKSKNKQNFYYNKKATKRPFAVGDKVLLLLPTEHSKLTVQWMGPYVVRELVGENDYRIDVDGKQKTFHGNMLKKYYERETTKQRSKAVLEEDKDDKELVCCGSLHMEIAQSGMVMTTKEEEYNMQNDSMFYPVKSKESWKDVVIAPDLSTQQQGELRELLKCYQDVLTDIPGRTKLAEFELELTEKTPFRGRPYPVPLHVQEAMKKRSRVNGETWSY